MINLHEPLLKGKEWKYIKHCLDSGWVSSAGQYIDIFEKKIAKYTNSKYAIACINGTSALQIALKLAGVKENQEVIVPSMTFIAPINAVKYNNAKPIFMDNNEHYTIDEKKTLDFLNNETKTVKKKEIKFTINKKTKRHITALIVVHVFGNAAKLDKLASACKEKNISLIEDAAESLGSFFKSGKYKNKHTGTIGKFGCLSFNGNKIITSGGGGMILTNDLKLAKKAKYLINQAKDDLIFSIHNDIGYNFRLTNIQAALGIAQMLSLKKYLKKKRKIHERYKEKINRIKGLKISSNPLFASCNNWLNVVEIKKNLSIKQLLSVIKYLYKNGIEVRPFWRPNHLQKKYRCYQTYKLDNVNKFYKNRLCLPSGVQLTSKQQDFIYSKLKNIF